MQIEIDDETLDRAFRENLLWHINSIQDDLKVLRSKKKLEKYQREEKVYFEKLLPALKVVGEYYGVK